MIREQLDFLTRKIEVIEKLLEGEIPKISKSAIQQAEKFPSGAANQAGVAIEAILYHIYEEKAKESGLTLREKITIQELKGELGKLKAGIPDTIMRNIDLIQSYRNQGSHYQKNSELSEVDLSSVLNSLIRVVEWYLEYAKGIKPDYSSLQTSVKEMEYTQLLRFSLMDGKISNKERISLDMKRDSLGISKERALEIEKSVASEESIQAIQTHFKLTPKIIKILFSGLVVLILAIAIYFLMPTATDRLADEYINMDCITDPLDADRVKKVSKEKRRANYKLIKHQYESNPNEYQVNFLEIYLTKEIKECKKYILYAEKLKELGLENKNLEELKSFYLNKGKGSLIDKNQIIAQYDSIFGKDNILKEAKEDGKTLSSSELKSRIKQMEYIYSKSLIELIIKESVGEEDESEE